VERLRGSIKIEHTLAARGANKLWELMHSEPYVPALGALTGGQAVQSVRAGLKAIYISGWCACLRTCCAAGSWTLVLCNSTLRCGADAVLCLVRRQVSSAACQLMWHSAFLGLFRWLLACPCCCCLQRQA